MPLRNDHDLATEVDGTMVSRASRTTVDMAPTGENADRYSALASSWGKSTSYDMVMQATDDPRESEGESELTTENYGTFYCHLCKKLDVNHVAMYEYRLRKHMRNRWVHVFEDREDCF